MSETLGRAAGRRCRRPHDRPGRRHPRGRRGRRASLGRDPGRARSPGCTAIPFEHVAEGAGRLWAGYERGWVREAPRFKADEALTADNELELCAHWGIREGKGRSAEIADRDADEISAVPAGQ